MEKTAYLVGVLLQNIEIETPWGTTEIYPPDDDIIGYVPIYRKKNVAEEVADKVYNIIKVELSNV